MIDRVVVESNQSTCPRCQATTEYLSGSLYLCPVCGVVSVRISPDRHTRCRRCRYDLRGSRSTRCPECGREVSPGQLNRLGLLRRERPEHRLLLLMDVYRRQQRRRIDRQRARHRCPSCRYDVQGLDSSRCPECGASIEFMKPETTSSSDLLSSGLMDDTVVRRLLPRHATLEQIYTLLRQNDFSTIRAGCAIFEIAISLRGRSLDEAAMSVLPRARTCHDLYRKLLDLGHDPISALRCILPHSRSFDH